MATVLSAEEGDYFERPKSSLRRSHSQTQFGTPTAQYQPSCISTQTYSSEKPLSDPYSISDSSSASSSPRTVHAESVDLSYVSTPATNFSIAEYDGVLGIDDAPEDHFDFPTYDHKLFLHPHYSDPDQLQSVNEPRIDHHYPISPAEHESGNTTRPITPDCSEHAEDDSAVVTRPSRQVDYLSHDWKEEDIWSSWRYVVSRRGEFNNSARLENASWRTWMKAKNNLKTVSPETLNWLKDCDVTWLYGPLQTGSRNLNPTHTEPSSHALSKSDSLVNLTKKPILKKRSMSEMMLQRSLSTASLLKQATAAVQAQEHRGGLRPGMVRAHTDRPTLPFSARRSSRGTVSSQDLSVDSSGIASPNQERRHIHFNEQVEQCIAVDAKADEDDDEPDLVMYNNDSDSDDGVMMKRTRTKKRKPLKRKSAKKATKTDGKIIAMLPSTTLKYRLDSPEPQETAMKHSTGILRSPLRSPHSSQETLRPSKESTQFLFADEDDEFEESLLNSKPGWRSPPFETPASGFAKSTSSGSLVDEPAGMRRTESGMLMPLGEDATPAAAGEGIFGRVIDTVNTARDIAHVIWNVGWRK